MIAVENVTEWIASEKSVLEDFHGQTMEHCDVSVLPGGSLESFALSQIKLAGYYGEKTFQVHLRIKVAEKTITTQASCFVLNIGFRGELASITDGTGEQVSKMCPNDEHIVVFQFAEESTLAGLRDKLSQGVEALRASCTDHRAESLRWMMDPFGKKYGETHAAAQQ